MYQQPKAAPRKLPPLSAHMIVTFQRIQYLEKCEAELKELKGEASKEELKGEGASHLPSGPPKWTNTPRLIPPENSAVINFEAPKHHEPLVRQLSTDAPELNDGASSPKKARPTAEQEAESMYGAGASDVAGPSDFPEQSKIAFDMHNARANNGTVEGVDEGEIMPNTVQLSKVAPMKPLKVAREKSPEPIVSTKITPSPALKDHSDRMPWYYIGD